MPDNIPARPVSHADRPADAARPLNQPVDRFSYDPVYVSIWEKSGPRGPVRTATFHLRYRDGNEWKASSSFGLPDLERLQYAVAEASARIERWQKSQNPPQSTTP